MTFIIGNRVHETSTTEGIVDYELAGPQTNRQDFVSGVGSGNRTYYIASEGATWEIGIGVVASGVSNTLSRDTILASSSGGGKIVWTTGTRDVVCTLPGEMFDRRAIAKSGAFTVTENDHGKLFECTGTGNTLDITLPAAAIASSGFKASFINMNPIGGDNFQIRGYDWAGLGLEEILGVAGGYVNIKPQRTVTVRATSSEDSWIIESEADSAGNTISGINGGSVLRTESNGLIVPAEVDLGRGNVSTTGSFPQPLMAGPLELWLVDVTAAGTLQFTNQTAATCTYSYKIFSTANVTGSVPSGATISIPGLSVGQDLTFWGAADSNWGRMLQFNAIRTANQIVANWIVTRN